MTAWLAKLWAKLYGWLALAGGVVLAVAAALVYGRISGKREQAGEDAAKDAKRQADDAKAAQQAQQDATVAAEKVQADAAKQPPPDAAKRDDFDTTS